MEEQHFHNAISWLLQWRPFNISELECNVGPSCHVEFSNGFVQDHSINIPTKSGTMFSQWWNMTICLIFKKKIIKKVKKKIYLSELPMMYFENLWFS